MLSTLDILRCIEAQIEEAMALWRMEVSAQREGESNGQSGQHSYDAFHMEAVLREGLVHCQILRRMIEEGEE